jgi:hypothetical protein
MEGHVANGTVIIRVDALAEAVKPALSFTLLFVEKLGDDSFRWSLFVKLGIRMGFA